MLTSALLIWIECCSSREPHRPKLNFGSLRQVEFRKCLWKFYTQCSVPKLYKMEKGEELYSSYISNCVFNAFLCHTVITLNIITTHALRKTLSLSKPLKTLLLSLAVSDLGVGLLVQPLYIAHLVVLTKTSTENDPSSSTTFIAFLVPANLFSYASFFGVVALSTDRFLAVKLHLRYQELVTHKHVTAVAVSIWVFSVFLSSIRRCIPVNITFLIYTIIEVVSVLTATFLNYKIHMAVQGHRSQIIQALQAQQVADNGELTPVNAARLLKSAAGTFYIYLVFLACYLPQMCMKVVVIISGDATATMHLYYYAWTIVFLNSSLNPIIYCWKMRHIRQAIVNTLRNMLLCHN